MARRADPAGSRWLPRLLLGYCALLIATWIGVSRWASIAPVPNRGALWPEPGSRRILDEESAGRVLAALRVAGQGTGVSTLAGGQWRGQASWWCGGRVIASSSVESDGQRITAPDFAASAALRALNQNDRSVCRLRLDIERGRGPVVSSIAPAFALSLVPGADAIGLDFGGREVVLGPDDLIASDLLGGYRPLAAVDVEAGLDGRAVLNHLALAAGADSRSWSRTPHHLFRVRVESWVEPAGADRTRAVALLRGHPAGLALSPAALHDAGLDAARYLERHLLPSGRFEYLYDPLADQRIPDSEDYSFPRHAGAAWYLAQAAAALAEPSLAAASAHAIQYLADHPPAGCDRPAWVCVGNPGDRTVDLGSTAMALLAATEYRRATSDPRFDPWARRLAAFLVMMQRPDGDFRHVYDLAADAPDDRLRLLYYSGEATFALSRIAADAGTAPAERAELAARVDRALSWLTSENYRYFAGGFFFGEDHWTCIAVDDAWELVGAASGRERYGDFCEGFADFIARSRFVSGEGPLEEQPHLLGSYGFSPLISPQPTPVGSRSEAMISTYRVAVRRGHAAAATRIAAGVRDGMRFLLSRQLHADGAWMMPDPAAAEGGFTMSDVKRQIRIDFQQHSGSAMLRAALVPALSTEESPPPGN